MAKNKEYYYNYYKQIIEPRGWKMISAEYIDRNKSLKMLCDKGHPVSQYPRDIKDKNLTILLVLAMMNPKSKLKYVFTVNGIVLCHII